MSDGDVPDHGEVVARRRRISLAWLFPVLAAAATAWLFWSQWKAKGTEIEIRFDDAPGLQAGKTLLIYRGVTAGKVTAVRLDASLQKVVVTVRLMAFANDLARQGTDFWIDQPVISLQQTTGLESIIQGNSIRARVRSGPPATTFDGLSRQPLDPLENPALIIKLTAPTIRFLDRGAPVFHRGVLAGSVRDKTLDANGDAYLHVLIAENFKAKVRSNARFWYAPAASLRLSPQGVKLEMPGIETVLQGGIEFDVFGEPGAAAETGATFALSASERVARAGGAPIEIAFDEGRGILAGETQVCYLGQAIGLVESVRPDPAGGVVRTVVRLEPAYDGLVTSGAGFTLVRPHVSLEGVSGLETLVTGVYIAFQPGAGEPARRFDGRTVPDDEWDQLRAEESGRHLVLRASHIPSLDKGAPVLHRGVTVGKVTEKTLAEDGEVILRLVVRPEFAGAVAANARFWRVPATSVKAGPGVLDVAVDGLEALIRGGVAFDVFGRAEGPAKDGAEFALAPDERTARLESPPIRIAFENGQGLLAGETQLRYRGVPVGLVQEVRAERGRVQVVARFEAGHDNLRGRGASFALVRPRISLDGVSGLEALVSGTYIDCQPGSTSRFADQFTGREAGAAVDAEAALEIVAVAASTNIAVEAPVFYRGVRVGKVVRKALAADARQVGLVIAIDAPYEELVRSNSRFWDVGGVKASMGFLSINVRTESLDMLMRGGIAFATPEDAKAGPRVKSGHEFPLASSPRPEWLRWAPQLSVDPSPISQP